MKKLSQEEVINRLINKRGTENFDYSKVIYTNRRTPIEIFCKKHNKTFSAYTESFIDLRKIKYVNEKKKEKMEKDFLQKREMYSADIYEIKDYTIKSTVE